MVRGGLAARPGPWIPRLVGVLLLGVPLLATSAVAAPATISRLEPEHGPAEGGTPVAIIGQRLDQVTDVTFAGQSIAFTLVSANEISVTSPAASASGPVQVTILSPDPPKSKTFTYDAPTTSTTPPTTTQTPPTTPTTTSPTTTTPTTTPTSDTPASSSPGSPPPTASSTATTSATTSDQPVTITVVSPTAVTTTIQVTTSSEPEETECHASIVPGAAGERVVVPFQSECGVASVVVNLPNVTEPLTLTVRRFTAWPLDVPVPEMGTPPALVFEADLRNQSGALVQPDTAVVQVRVPGPWLDLCPAEACRPQLLHYHDGEWDRVELTTVDRFEDGWVLEGTTRGFSVFAVAGIKIAPPSPSGSWAWLWLLAPVGFAAVLAPIVVVRRRRAVPPDTEAKVSRLLTEMQHREEILQFVNNAAHDLANPLTPIQLQLDLLAHAAEQRADESQKKSLKIVERNVEQLAHLIQDLRDASKLQAGKLRLNLHHMDLAQLVRDAAESYQAQARLANVELVIEAVDSLRVEADPGQVNRVVTNFLSNALKFTPAGGRIRILAAREEGMAMVFVRDTGAGLSAEDLQRLFKPFSQVEGEARKKGTGLGLFIAKGIVEAHGGRIGCSSEGRGRGSTFWFALPFEAEPKRQEDESPRPKHWRDEKGPPGARMGGWLSRARKKPPISPEEAGAP